MVASEPPIVRELADELSRLADSGGVDDVALADAPTLQDVIAPMGGFSVLVRLIDGWPTDRGARHLRQALLAGGAPLRNSLESRVARASPREDRSAVGDGASRYVLQLAWLLYDQFGAIGAKLTAPGDLRESTDNHGSRNVMVSGYTAAGKTTHAQLLAQELGYDYVSASTVLADRAQSSRDEPWRRRRAVLRRRSVGTDLALDWLMIEWARTRRRVVFDAWVLPALAVRSRALTIWIHSSLESRARKCSVSQSFGGSRLSTQGCRELVESIDHEADQRFESLYSVTYSSIADTADIVLDNSTYMPRATLAAAERGIRGFHPILSAAVKETL